MYRNQLPIQISNVFQIVQQGFLVEYNKMVAPRIPQLFIQFFSQFFRKI